VDEWKAAVGATNLALRSDAQVGVLEKLGNRLENIGTSGPINDHGELKAKFSYYHARL